MEDIEQINKMYSKICTEIGDCVFKIYVGLLTQSKLNDRMLELRKQEAIQEKKKDESDTD